MHSLDMFGKCCSTRAALSRPYIERKRLEDVVRGHLKGDRNYTTEIHKVLTLELVHRLFLDSE